MRTKFGGPRRIGLIALIIAGGLAWLLCNRPRVSGEIPVAPALANVSASPAGWIPQTAQVGGESLSLEPRLVGKARVVPSPPAVRQAAKLFSPAASFAAPLAPPDRPIFPDGHTPPRDPVLSAAQERNLSRLRWGLAKDLEYRGDSEKATVRLLASSVLAEPEDSTKSEPAVLAARFLAENRDLLLLRDPDTELTASAPEPDGLGGHVVRFHQHFAGIEVWPGRLTANTNARGALTVITGAYEPTPENISLTPALTPADALEKAALHLGAADPGAADVHSPAKLKIYTAKNRAPELSYEVVLEVGGRHERVFVGAQTGDILLSYSEVCTGAVTGSGKDVLGQTKSINLYSAGSPVRYYLYDATKPMYAYNPAGDDAGYIAIFDASKANAPVAFSTSATGGHDPEGVGALFNVGKTYDFFRQEFGRNSYDNQGTSLLIFIREAEPNGAPLFNAFWDGSRMGFGTADRFTAATDVIGHEFTHAVVQETAGLVYAYESGALNESFSDILGESFERYLGGTQDWLIGSALKPTNPVGGAFRSMKNPNAKNQPARMSQFIRTTQDNGGVHINSGIPNHAFYQLAEGLPSGGIGFVAARNIFYRALTTKLNANSDFQDLRDACVKSAEELHGAGSTQAAKTALAFNAVEIFARVPPAPSPDLTPVTGPNSFLATDLYGDGYFYLGRRESALGDSASTMTTISSFAVNRFSRPTLSGDGALAAYITPDFDFVVVDTLAASAKRANFAGLYNSASLSPDKKHLALILRDSAANKTLNQINYVNLDAGTDTTIDLYLPVADGPNSVKITTIDEIDISPDGQTAVFDGVAETTVRNPNGSSKTIRAWSLFAVNLTTHDVFVLGGPYEGVNIGNPAFARTSASRITFDLEIVNAFGNTTSSAICTVDLIKDDSFDIVGEYTPASRYSGYPSFSAADDAITYTETYYYFGSPYPRVIGKNLLADKLTATGSAVLLQEDSHAGLIYRRGTFVGAPVIAVTALAPTIVGGTTGKFRLSRVGGDPKIPVPVTFKLIGTARPGADYTAPNPGATIPANQSFVDVSIASLLVPESPSRLLTLTLDPKSGYLLSGTASQASVTLTAPPLTYAHWASAKGAGAASADDDGDGIANFLEYVLGTNPKSSSGGYITPEIVEVGLQRFLQLRVARSSVQPGVSWNLQRSSNRAAWINASSAIVKDTATELVVRDSLPLQADETRYLRLRFSAFEIASDTASIGLATLNLGGLTQTYAGLPRQVTVTGAPAGVTPVVTYNGSTKPPVNAGTYTVNAAANAADVLASATATLTITKASLTASAPNLSRLQGLANPPLAIAYQGFVGTETAKVLNVPPKAVTTATKASPIGEYPITLSPATDNNYAITLVPGILRVGGFGGAYEAFVHAPDARPVGKIEITVPTSSLNYTGVLNLAAESNPISFKGTLVSAAGYASATHTFTRPASPGLPSLRISFSLAGAVLGGTLHRDDLPLGTLAQATRLAPPPAPLGNGAHTMVLYPGDQNSAPDGSGHATATIAATTGVLSLSGKLADGTPLTASLRPAADRSYRVWVNPYAKRAQSFLTGRLGLKSHPDALRFPGRYYLPVASSRLLWQKAASPAKPLDAAFRSGFGPLEIQISMDPWIAPSAKPTATIPAGTLAERLGLPGTSPARALVLAHSDIDGISDATLPTTGTLSGGALTVPANATAWKITIKPDSGLFSGSFVLKDPAPAKARTITFNGVLRQRPDLAASDKTIGAGQFLFAPSGAASTSEKTSGDIRFATP